MAAVSFAFLLLVIIRSQFRCLVLPQPVIMSTFSAAFDALYEHRHLLTTEDFELRKAELRAQWPLLGGSVAATATNIAGCSGSASTHHHTPSSKKKTTRQLSINGAFGSPTIELHITKGGQRLAKANVPAGQFADGSCCTEGKTGLPCDYRGNGCDKQFLNSQGRGTHHVTCKFKTGPLGSAAAAPGK